VPQARHPVPAEISDPEFYEALGQAKGRRRRLGTPTVDDHTLDDEGSLCRGYDPGLG
jgi:hypothetical protein